MKKLKLCKDCKWCELNIRTDHSECKAPQNITQEKSEPDLVTGKIIEIAISPRWKFCAHHRGKSRYGAWELGFCGRHARWFEPKEDKPLLEQLKQLSFLKENIADYSGVGWKSALDRAKATIDIEDDAVVSKFGNQRKWNNYRNGLKFALKVLKDLRKEEVKHGN